MDQQPERGDTAGQDRYTGGAGCGEHGVDRPGEEAETGQPAGQDQERGRDFDGAGRGEPGGGRFREAVDGQQAGQEEQGAEGGGSQEAAGRAGVAEAGEEQERGERAQEERDRAEEQGAYARAEVREPVGPGEPAARLYGEQVGAPGPRGQREREPEQGAGAAVQWPSGPPLTTWASRSSPYTA